MNTYYIDRILQVLDLLDSTVEEIPTLDELAKKAGFSPFHFHRLFRAFVGEPVASYAKRVRLEKAAKQLSFSKEDITQIALDSGYETSSAFSKSFKARFEMTPSKWRSTRSEYTPTSVSLSFEQNQKLKMKTEIANLEPQEIYYVRATGKYGDAAAEAFGKLMPFAYGNRIMKKDTSVFGITHDDPSVTKEENIRYDACFSAEAGIATQGDVRKKTLAGGKYLQVLHKGPYENLSETYNAIYKQWLPESGEALRDAPVFEKYLNRDPRRTKPENLKTLLHIPLKG